MWVLGFEKDLHKVKQEDHSHDRTSGTFVAGLGVDSRARSPDAEDDEHTDTGNHEQDFPPEHIDKENREADGDEERPDLETAIEERLMARVGDANRLQDIVQVVRHEAVSGTLTEECYQYQQEESLPVAWRLEEDGPALFGVLFLQADGGFDLCHLRFDELIVTIAIGMVLNCCVRRQPIAQNS